MSSETPATSKPATVCKHIGVEQDPATHFQFASAWNLCHRSHPPQGIAVPHQARYCLVSAHRQCPVFQPDWTGVYPPGIRAIARKSNGGRRKLRNWLAVTALAAISLVAAVQFDSTPTPSLVPAATSTLQTATPTTISGVSMTGTASFLDGTPPQQDPLPLPQPTGTATRPPSPSETPTATGTPLPTPGPGLETPFGPGMTYLIHVVAQGESYTSIAADYGTTVSVLERANPTPAGSSLWAGRPIVIPLGRTDPEGLPAFSIIFTTETTLVVDLAAAYGASADQIRFYNRLGAEPTVPSGRWLVIPLETDA